MAFLAPRKRQAALARHKRASKARLVAGIAAMAGCAPDARAVVAAVSAHVEVRREARAAWRAADDSRARGDLERRWGVLVALRTGELAVARRADRLPPGSRPLSAVEARAELELGTPCVVVGIHGTRSPRCTVATFERAAGPLLLAV